MTDDRQAAIQTELTQVTDRIRRLQRTIAAVGQPVSQLELFELRRLGRRYGALVAELKRIEADHG